jgi:Putative prokaryotic signal transducing protein
MPAHHHRHIIIVMDHPKLVIVYTCGTRPEADLAKSELESAGIQSMIQSDSIGGMREHVAWSGLGYRVLVREEDKAAAQEVLTPPADAALPDEGASEDLDTLRSGRRLKP